MSVIDEIASTPHGDIKYEVVECSSCGEEVRKKHATEFTLGDRDGWACDWCTENGPIEFRHRGAKTEGTGLAFTLFFALFWPLLFPLAIWDRDNLALYYLAGSAGAVLYVYLVARVVGLVP